MADLGNEPLGVESLTNEVVAPESLDGGGGDHYRVDTVLASRGESSRHVAAQSDHAKVRTTFE